MRVLGGIGRLTIATLLAGVLVAGLLLPYSLGLGLTSNKITNALADTSASELDGDMPERSTIEDNAGNPIAYVYNQNRIVVPFDEISNNLKVAIVAVEDRRFGEHKGVDWRGTVRALLNNASATDGAGQQGGSTLTQQYVKNFLFLVKAKTDAEKAAAIATSAGRKLREAKLALTLEQKETKDDILDGYLNLVAFLPNVYGAEATAQALFGVHAADLTLSQAALMAGMVNNPNRFDPLDTASQDNAKARRNIVLGLLQKAKSITTAQMTKAQAEPLGTDNGKQVSSGCVPATNAKASTELNQRRINGYFCQYVMDYLSAQGLTQDMLAGGGYTVKTTLDPAKMKAAHDAVVAQANHTANPRVANVLSVVEPTAARRVLALTANVPYGLGAGQTVQKLTTTFVPLGGGSTFKIFTAAAALQAGLGIDSTISNPQSYSSLLSPKPFVNDTDGNETFPTTLQLKTALATSPNTAFVKLEDEVGLAKVVNMAVALGLKSYQYQAGEVDQLFADKTDTYAQEVVAQKIASFTLGVTPISPLELANVGATLADSGTWCPPTPVDTVLDRNGKVYQLKAAAACSPAVSKDLAASLTEAMNQDVIDDKGSANQAAKASGWPLSSGTTSGKTGTTGEYRASAYLGYTPSYSAAALTWDYQTHPQSICINPSYAATKPLALAGTCTLAEAKSGEKNTTSKKVGMTGGSVPAATWFAAMKVIQPPGAMTVFPPSQEPFILGSPGIKVPNVVGSTSLAAQQTLTAAGFKVAQAIVQHTGRPANEVTAQDPGQDIATLPGSTVTISVSAG